MEDPIWYSPYSVLFHIEKIKNAFTDSRKLSKVYKKVIEAEAIAKMLVGISKGSGKDFWMQAVDDKHGSPDIKTLCYSEDTHPNFDFLEVQHVEVVEYEEHSTGDLVPFIEKTKFSSQKAYDKNTHILCHIGEKTRIYIPNTSELKRQIAASKINCPVLFMGSPDDVPDSVYRIIQLYPAVRLTVEFDLKEEYDKNSRIQPAVMFFKRGKKAPLEKREGEKHFPFERLGLIPGEKGEY